MYKKMIQIICGLLLCTACGSEPVHESLDTETPVVQLSVTDTIGVELGDSCYVFGYAADAARTDSIIFVLDMSRAQLRKYTPAGEYAGHIGNRGDGPGELAHPQWFELFPDGSIILQDITDLGLYNPQGEWEKHIFTHSGNWPSQHTVTGAATFAIRWHEFIREPPLTLRQFIASYDLDGNALTEFMTDSILVPVDPEDNNDALNRMLFSHYFAGDINGNLYVVQRHTPEYRIVCLASDGIAFDTLSLDLPSVEKTANEISLEKQHVEEYLTGMGSSDVMRWIYEPDSCKEPIAGIWLGWEGNLWVLRGTEENPVFDVWSIPEGDYLYRAELNVEIPPTEFLTFYINPYCKGFLAVHEDEAMVQRILLIEAE